MAAIKQKVSYHLKIPIIMLNRNKPGSILFILITLLINSYLAEAQMQKLQISDNGRFLVREDGCPFIWIGETNWFFAKLPPNVIDSILNRRSSQGFTVMLVSCREKLYNGDGPGKIGAPNLSWWNYLDDYIAKCEKRGLYVGITLGWWGILMHNTENNLFEFGKWVGHRYRDNNNIIWLTLGESGSYSRKKKIIKSRLNALVEGIRKGDSGNKLLTIHADYKRGTSLTEDDKLCDFNNWQTSQWCCPDDLPKNDERQWRIWDAIMYDYNKLYKGTPKPTIDLEAWYENNKDFCGTSPFIIRRRAYFTLFAGAFGHNYGAGGIWDGLISSEKCSKNALSALYYPGALQISNVSNFLHSLGDDFLKIIPDQTIIKHGNSNRYDNHIQALVSDDKTFSLIYSASDSPYKLDLNKLTNRNLVYVWYNPRTNSIFSKIKIVKNKNDNEIIFNPPEDKGAGNDWILILGTKQFIDKIRTNIENRS